MGRVAGGDDGGGDGVIEEDEEVDGEAQAADEAIGQGDGVGNDEIANAEVGGQSTSKSTIAKQYRSLSVSVDASQSSGNEEKRKRGKLFS
jgi:hypothetical protein